MNTIVFTRRADVADAAALGKHKYCIILKEQCWDGGRGGGGEKGCLGCNLNLGAHKASRAHTFLPIGLRVCPLACCAVCLDWGWGISLGPCCGWTCPSPLFRGETLIISLVWTVITPSLFWAQLRQLPRASDVGRRSCGSARAEKPSHPTITTTTPKSILETEAEGDVTHQYAHRPLCPGLWSLGAICAPR